MSTLRFVSRTGGGELTWSLLAALAYEVSIAGDGVQVEQVTIDRGEFPAGGDDDVYVIAVDEPAGEQQSQMVPSQDQLARTIGLSAARPGTDAFRSTALRARTLPVCLAIHSDSAAQLQALGINCERIRLGYSERWDRWRGRAVERAHDVVFSGTAEERSARLFALGAGGLDDLDVVVAPRYPRSHRGAGDEHERMERRLDRLAQTELALCFAATASRSPSWIEWFEAMCNGCVVVAEYGQDLPPLRPGKDLVIGRPHALPLLACGLVEDPARVAAIREHCYETLRTSATLRPAATLLGELAAALRAGSVRSASRPRHLRLPVTIEPDPAGLIQVGEAAPRPDTRAKRRAVRESAKVLQAASVEENAELAIAVLPGARDGLPDWTATLTSIALQLDELDGVIHLCTAGPLTADPRPPDGWLLVEHPAADLATGLRDVLRGGGFSQLLLVAAGDILSRNAVRRMRAALAREDDDAAYGIVIDPRFHLVGAMPFDRELVREWDPFPVTSLWKAESLLRLGDWSEESEPGANALSPLWRALARSGGSAAWIPRPVARQMLPQSDGMLGVATASRRRSGRISHR